MSASLFMIGLPMKKETDMETKYFKVEAKMGHVGRNHYLLKEIYVEAMNKKEAAAKVRMFPRVKHNHKDAIRSVKEVEYGEYLEGKKGARRDGYIMSRNIQQQRALCSSETVRVFCEATPQKLPKPTHARRIRVEKQKEKEWFKERTWLYE